MAKSAASVEGVEKVVCVEHAELEHGVAEAIAPALQQLHGSSSFSHIVAPANSTGTHEAMCAVAVPSLVLTTWPID